MNNPDSPWHDAKVYQFGKRKVAVIRAQSYDPVRWYTELHVDGRYRASYGSRAILRWLAVLVALLKGRHYE